MEITSSIKAAILSFADTIAPEAESVWLTGSRVHGDAEPDSDWDVLVITPRASNRPEDFAKSNQTSGFTLDGGHIEVVIAHPDHWRDGTQRYLVECRASGIRLR